MSENLVETVAETLVEAAVDAAELAVPEAIVAEVVGKWLISHIHGSPVARHTEALNHLNASLPALQAELVKAVKG